MEDLENNIIIGHEKNKKYLEELWENNKFPRRVIFSGIKSIGKFSLALLVAQKIVIKNKVKFDDYDKIIDRFFPDILIVKGEDNAIITIDEVRKISSFVKMTSYQAKNKIIIIDNSENMNVNAQNSLLKILEDSHIDNIFILVTHSSASLLPTVRSRMQEIKFFPMNVTQAEKILAEKPSDESTQNFCKNFFSLGFIKKWTKNQLFFLYQKLLEYMNSEKMEFSSFERQVNTHCKKYGLEHNVIYEIIELTLSQLMHKKFDFSYYPLFPKEEFLLEKLNKKSKIELFSISQKIIKLIAEQKKYFLDSKQTLYIILTILKEN